jgi:hypothetical protein
MVKMSLLVCLIAFATSPCLTAEIGFVEDFSLAPDRTVPLKQLIPGTEEYYYYHCLHFQNTEQFDKVEETLAAWIKRYKYTARVHEIINRQALLTFEKHPEKTLARIRERLGLRFDHQRELLDRKPNLPTKLDPNAISRDALTKRAMSRYQNLQGFEATAHDWLIKSNLNADRRRHLLSMLQRPDHANLPKLVVDDLKYKYSKGFGSFNIHRQLLLSQLDECLKLKTDLLNQGTFVNTYLTKLQPNPDVNWRTDKVAYEAYLDRLWSFASKLAPVHNSIKAHVLYHRLVHDRARGEYDADRFMAYVKLPRPTGYVEPKFMQLENSRRYPCNLNADYRSVTLLPPVGNDEPLVRSYLMHFFKEAANFDAFTSYIRDDYLKHTFAETKIVNGLGDPEQWYSMLPPAKYQQLKERVDLDFAFTNGTQFDVGGKVSLDVHVKNVETLIVKVFEINTGNYYRERRRELNTDINLDGLVPYQEKTHTFDDPPLRRVRRHFEFPKLNDRGAYVIDFIGNGKSSRALVRKGKLRYIVRNSTAGHIFTVLDEQNKHLPEATLWMSGNEYRPDDDGLITVPFSNQPGRQTIILSQGDFSSLDNFGHKSEIYSLAAGIFVDRESLLQLQTSRVVVRPMLKLNGRPVTLAILKDVKLRITSTDLDGVSTSKEVSDFELHSDQESTYDFQVPPRLASISFSLQAKVKNFSQDKEIDLAANQSFTLNQIDSTEKVEDLHFSKIDRRYVIDVLGKSGEPRSARPVQLKIKHRDFRNTFDLSLQSDAAGRVSLGALEDIAVVTATGAEGTSHSWAINDDAHNYYRNVQGQAGQSLALPYMGDGGGLQRSELSLLELRGGTFVADHFDAMGVKNGTLQIGDLPRGDFDLLIKRSGTRIAIRMADGESRHNYVLGEHRFLQRRVTKPVQIDDIDIDDKFVSVQLGNASKNARLHVFAVRFDPAYEPFGILGRVRDMEPGWRVLPMMPSAYVAGRQLGEEFQYIINRRYAKKFSGNMLNRPSLLLNPWPIRATETSVQEALEGEEFGATARRFGGKDSKGKSRGGSAAGAADFANLDFLGQGSTVLVNLKPDEEGLVKINRELIGQQQHLNFVAVDPLSTTFRTVSLPEVKREIEDMRLIAGLDPDEHFTQQKQISVVKADKTLEIADVTSSQFDVYDSLPRVYGLYMTLTGDAKLAEFSFILNWNSLKPDEQRSLYSEYACHELNFFLMKKDREFFDEVILPHLKNKKDTTYLDRWLLGEELDEYVKPWNHGQLNAVERILLAQRIKGEPPKTARHIGDLFDLIPPNTERFNHLFKTALKGRALDTGDALGVAGARKHALTRRELEARGKSVISGLSRDLSADMPADPAADPSAARAGTKPATRPPGAMAFKEAKKAQERLGDLQRRAAGNRDGLSDKAEEDVEELLAELGDADRRASARQLYRKLDKTQEWVENNYYKLPIAQQNAQLVQVNGFWNDYAAHDPKTPFYSTNLTEASRNFTEMMFALSVLDLPMEGETPETKFDGAHLTLTARTPLVVFREEVLPAKKIAEDTPILVSQNFFRRDDRYRFDGNQRLDKYVTEEFLFHTVYGCQIVVTNPTSSPRKLDLLLQIPVGSMPVLGGRETKSVQINLQPYQTQSIEYFFYFPAPGEFPHYPVQVAQDEELLAYAEPVLLNVVRQLSRIDRSSWGYISQHGTEDDIIKFINANNINRHQLDKIAWRMKDAAFFQKVTSLLALRHVYNHTLWSYSVMHGNVPTIQQFLQHANGFIGQCGEHLVSPLLVIDPVVRKTHEHMDYRPLVNARAHQLGRRRQILNDRFHCQYHRLMKLLGYKRQLNDDDLMAVTYYMLLQDRVEEALGYFGDVNVDRLTTRMQYDYFNAHLNFFRSEPQLGAEIAANYASYPIDRWREAFVDVTSQFKEIDGAAVDVIDDEDREQQQTQLAATAPSFDFQVESRKAVVNYQNLSEAKVNYYLMDIELLFSSNPFVQEYGGRFSFIRPNLSATVELDAKGNSATFALPEQFHNSNVLVEITAGGQTKSKAYYANSLNVQTVENYGHLHVAHADSRKPLSTVYVKAYARMKDGRVRFYKDGYTDLRGRFDYTSLNTNELDFVDRFSLLILSEDHGAIVREAQPPKR